MGDVIQIGEVKSERDKAASAAFAEYLALKEVSDTTKDFTDGRKTAKAWKRFLEHYCGRF